MTYTIVIDISDRQLYLFENTNVIKSFPIGVGKFTSPSPNGVYHVVSKVSNPGGPFGAMWLGLSIPHYGIHGTNNPASIGGYVSKGCVRMYNNDVLVLAKIIPIGTQVKIVP